MIVEDNPSGFDSFLHWAVKITLILGQSYMDTLILTSLLVSMGISTNQQRIYLFAGVGNGLFMKWEFYYLGQDED